MIWRGRLCSRNAEGGSIRGKARRNRSLREGCVMEGTGWGCNPPPSPLGESTQRRGGVWSISAEALEPHAGAPLLGAVASLDGVMQESAIGL